MKIAQCLRAKNLREGDRVLLERGWTAVTYVDFDGYWREKGVVKVEFADGDWESLELKNRVLVLR